MKDRSEVISCSLDDKCGCLACALERATGVWASKQKPGSDHSINLMMIQIGMFAARTALSTHRPSEGQVENSMQVMVTAGAAFLERFADEWIAAARERDDAALAEEDTIGPTMGQA